MDNRFAVFKQPLGRILLTCLVAMLLNGCIKQRHAVVPPPPDPSVTLGDR